MRYYTVEPGKGIDSLQIREADVPQPGRRQVLVRMRAASLNFRDLLISGGAYPVGVPDLVVPLSDGAGEVVAVGADCSRFAAGDRVAGIFMQSWIGGDMEDSDAASALGGAIDGVLSEYRLFEEDGLVRIPEHLSFEDAATLPCAAVTAWNALHGMRGVDAAQTVLLLGTGGVSIFALQLARAAGARVIITSSSDDKLEQARALGADETINYAKTPDWAAKATELTGGRGVDMVVETGGPGTLASSVAATRRGGVVQMIGVLSLGQIDPLPILVRGVTVRGIMVGSREMFDAMNRTIDFHRIKPVINRTFGFDEAQAAYAHLQSANHVGKVVIRID